MRDIGLNLPFPLSAILGGRNGNDRNGSRTVFSVRVFGPLRPLRSKEKSAMVHLSDQRIWPGLHCPAILLMSDILLNKLKTGCQMTHLVVEICTEMPTEMVYFFASSKMQSLSMLTEKANEM